jgi:hypothetical protein
MVLFLNFLHEEYKKKLVRSGLDHPAYLAALRSFLSLFFSFLKAGKYKMSRITKRQDMQDISNRKIKGTCGKFLKLGGSIPIPSFVLVLFLLSSSLTAASWNITVTPDKKEMTLNQELIVTIRCQHPQNYSPLFSLYVSELKKNTLNFSCVAYEVKQSELILHLQPLHTSHRLIFLPGILSFAAKFDGDKKSFLLPACVVDCRSFTTKLMPMPPLPMNPEQAMGITKDNKARIFQKAAVQERERNEKVMGRRVVVQSLFTWILLSAVGCLLTFWFLIEYDRFKPKKKQEVKTRNVIKEYRLLSLSKEPLSSRFTLLKNLIVEFLSQREKKPLHGKTTEELLLLLQGSDHYSQEVKSSTIALLTRLNEIEFTPTPYSEEDWQKLLHEFQRKIAILAKP